MGSTWFDRLALKIGGLVLLGGLVLAVLQARLTGIGLAAPIVLALGAGVLTYGAAHFVLSGRIARASTTLRRIRRRQFEDLEPDPPLGGDELDQLLRQVYHTGRALQREIEELKKMENYRKEFLGNVSHELKTPIFSIQGFTETLLDGALEDTRVNRRFLRKIAKNAGRLDNLAQDLSDIARIETGELQMQIQPFDLADLAEEVVESVGMRAREKEITLRCEVSPHLPKVEGDRERIRQVLVNLVDNAIKYNNEGGYVELRSDLLPDERIRVAVVDNGIGIDPEDAERLTERFYRVDKSRSREQGGTGLGLAIVKHILEAHDEQLQIESTPGEGSTFWFALSPVRKTAEE